MRHELLDDAPSVLARIKAHDECRSRVAESELPERQAWRDRRLMALAAHLNRARTEIGSPRPAPA